MKRHRVINLEKQIFDFCIWFLAVICLLALLTSSCSATVALPTTPTIAVTASAQLTATAEKEPLTPTPQVCTVQTGVPSGYLNLRAGAGTNYALIRVLREGEILTVLERGIWLAVLDSQGHKGYVNARFCR